LICDFQSYRYPHHRRGSKNYNEIRIAISGGSWKRRSKNLFRRFWTSRYSLLHYSTLPVITASLYTQRKNLTSPYYSTYNVKQCLIMHSHSLQNCHNPRKYVFMRRCEQNKNNLKSNRFYSWRLLTVNRQLLFLCSAG